ncbi:MAG: anthranilate phosphoribosyltransferase family protein [Prochlorococcus sp.]
MQCPVNANAEISCRERFKVHLRKIGSGEHTSKGLTREEAAEAMAMILREEASPAQIGAFLIAHRIRRPEPQELAGMLDTYRALGPSLRSPPGQRRPVCLGMPFDGRNRTAPIYPLTALVLLSLDQPVVLQGGNRMPIKYGVTAAELFQSLGLSLTGQSIEQIQTGFDQHGLALIHQPDHFPLAETLVYYREELGKRPPVASLELLWTAHQGDHLLVSGFVHPPTEGRAWKTLEIAGEPDVITVKGLEGSTDLPISRACVTAQVRNSTPERLILHPRDHDCFGEEPQWTDPEQWRDQALEALQNRGALKDALRWNAGAYLWLTGLAENIEAGISKVEQVLRSGAAQTTLDQLIAWRSLTMG